jgi:hypothetical protein
MNKRVLILKKIEKNLANSPKFDTVLTLFKSLLSLSKIGSPISVLISDFIPSRRFLRLETFAEELSNEFKKVEERIDIEFITTDEFAFLFEQCFKAASENYQEEKLSAFKAIIINSTIDQTLIPVEKEFFLNLTKQLTILHIQILTFLHDAHEYISKKKISENQLQGGGYRYFLPIIFPNIDFDTIKIVIDDLNNYGLTSLKSSDFGVITFSSGLQLMGNNRTTSFGEKYLEFITLKE